MVSAGATGVAVAPPDLFDSLPVLSTEVTANQYFVPLLSPVALNDVVVIAEFVIFVQGPLLLVAR